MVPGLGSATYAVQKDPAYISLFAGYYKRSGEKGSDTYDESRALVS